MKMKRRAAVALTTMAFAFAIAGPGVVAAAAPGGDSPAVSTVSSHTTSASNQMTRQEFERLKAALNSSRDFTRTVTTSPGVRTYTYTYRTGSALVLTEPFGAPAPISPQLRVNGCGFLQLCVFLNRVDQGAIAAGGAFAIGAAICLLPGVGQAVCIGVGTALTVAAFYIASYGICSNELQVELFPWPGTNLRCV